MSDDLNAAVEEFTGDMAERVQVLVKAAQAEVSTYQDRIDALAEDLDDMRHESRGADGVLFWVDEVVREAEGLMMDDVSPAAILVRMVNELSSRRSLTYANERPLSAVV